MIRPFPTTAHHRAVLRTLWLVIKRHLVRTHAQAANDTFGGHAA